MFRLYDIIDSEPLTQDFNLNNEIPYVVKGFYPYIYVKDFPIGAYVFRVLKNGVTIFQKPFTSTTIQNYLETNKRSMFGFIPMIPDQSYLLLGKGRYTAQLYRIGGGSSENSHMGWIRIANYRVNDYASEPESEGDIPFAMKMKILERV